MPTSDRLVAVAAHGLAGSRTELPPGPLSEPEWFDLVQGCVAADLVGFLAAAAAAGDLVLTPGQADELAVLVAEHAGLSLLVERRAVTASSVLTAAGIDHRVVDGPARRLAYGDAALRPARRAHVLVPPARLAEARALQGPAPAGSGPRTERLVLLASLPGLAEGPAGGGAASETGGAAPLLVRLGPPAHLELAGCRVPVLSLEQQLVAAALEVAGSPVVPLARQRDVAQLALSAGLDAAAARRLAEALGLTGALAEAIALAWGTFDLADKTELSVWAQRVAGRRPHQAAERPAPAPVARKGFAQRVLRRSPAPAGVPVATTMFTSGPGMAVRAPWSTRRR
ncbi:MAG: hypothetical protein C0P77_010160 [Thermoanaerobacterales bacterium]|jgi:hypothetical protein|nr:hypothetical protein [Thermoanaerobacterales bacterium]